MHESVRRSHIKFIMNYLELHVTVPDEITLASIYAMYHEMLPHIYVWIRPLAT